MTNRTEVSFEDFPVTGSITGTFLGSAPSDVSFVGSASWADTSRTSSLAETASLLTGFVESASFAATASIVLGGIESASFAATAALAETASTAISAAFADNSILAQLATSSISASFGTITGSFLGSDSSSISFEGSATFAPKSFSSSFALTASNVGPGGIISGATLVVADVAPTVIGLNSTLGSFTNLTGIDETIAELGDGLTRLKLALDDFNEARVSVATDVVDGKGEPVQLAAQFSLDQVNWSFFTAVSESAGAFLTQSNTVAESAFIGLVSESKTDVFVRVVTYNGPSVGAGATAKIGSIFIQFR